MKKLLKLLKNIFSFKRKSETNIIDTNFSTESKIGGFMHFYIKDGKTKNKFIPVELKDDFLEKFGHDLLNTDEYLVDEFIKKSKQK
jgi:hypothetical protein